MKNQKQKPLEYFASRRTPLYVTSGVKEALKNAGYVKKEVIEAYDLNPTEVEKVKSDQADLIIAWLVENVFRRAEQLRSQGIPMDYIQEIKFTGNVGTFGVKRVTISQYGLKESHKQSIKFSCPVPTHFTGTLWMEETWNGAPPEEAGPEDHYITLMFPEER